MQGDRRSPPTEVSCDVDLLQVRPTPLMDSKEPQEINGGLDVESSSY